MKEKFIKFMYGRNGVDELARFESILIWITLVLSIFIRNPFIQMILSFMAVALIVHLYFRIFSKNTSKRYEENQKFRNWRYNMAIKRNNHKKRREQRAIYKYFKCPMCKQQVRVPRGHGKIIITCPKCREEFARRS